MLFQSHFAAFELASREMALLLNNLLLAGACAAVFFGTLYPLALDALTGEKISVGPPYFAIFFAPIFVVLLILVPFGPRLGWRQGDLEAALRILAPAAGVAAVAGIMVLAIAEPKSLAAAGAFALAAWVISASAIDLVRRKRERAISVSALASALAHAGLGVTLMGIAGTTVWKSETTDLLRPGETAQVAGYTLRLDKMEKVTGPNYFAQRADISVLRGDRVIATLSPEKRSYPAEGQAMTETAIRTTGVSDLYVALGDERDGGRWVVRAYVNPLAPFIWFGGALMALGGMASLWGRLAWHRLRLHSLAAAE